MNSKYLVFSLFVLIFVSAVSSGCVSTSCKCPKGLPQGQYCGGSIGCDRTKVYECNPRGGTCSYGYRKSCANCGRLPQGQYCGGSIGCVYTDVYECSPDGKTCSYGYRKSCAECGALSCPPEKRRLL
ncbi:hypothetical protein Glove_490g49 [Diversispora epigaea]|uniref:TNFR-Cys domain-containing protein n=1 Tax=Diversispora epigaea TaxID=1348612 RepID=A0A397GMW8_9GLOM|nr:hypothetical protein Glove_490g49 [Diversispora epigaea]